MLLLFFIDQSLRLLYINKQLKDHDTLGDHGIRNRDTLIIIARLPGGGGMYVTTVYQSQLYIIKVLTRLYYVCWTTTQNQAMLSCFAIYVNHAEC